MELCPLKEEEALLGVGRMDWLLREELSWLQQSARRAAKVVANTAWQDVG